MQATAWISQENKFASLEIYSKYIRGALHEFALLPYFSLNFSWVWLWDIPVWPAGMHTHTFEILAKYA
jgi:hypothetical protein